MHVHVQVPNRRFKEQILDRVASATSDIKKQTLQRQAAERQFVEAATPPCGSPCWCSA